VIAICSKIGRTPTWEFASTDRGLLRAQHRVTRSSLMIPKRNRLGEGRFAFREERCKFDSYQEPTDPRSTRHRVLFSAEAVCPMSAHDVVSRDMFHDCRSGSTLTLRLWNRQAACKSDAFVDGLAPVANPVAKIPNLECASEYYAEYGLTSFPAWSARCADSQARSRPQHTVRRRTAKESAGHREGRPRASHPPEAWRS
jgi:hypothetical protein